MNPVSPSFDVVALTSYLCSVETWGCVRAHFACHMCFRLYLCIGSQGTTGIFDMFGMRLDGCFRSPCSVNNTAIKVQKSCGQCPGNRTPPISTLHGHHSHQDHLTTHTIHHAKHPQAFFCMKSLVIQKQEPIEFVIVKVPSVTP